MQSVTLLIRAARGNVGTWERGNVGTWERGNVEQIEMPMDYFVNMYPRSQTCVEVGDEVIQLAMLRINFRPKKCLLDSEVSHFRFEDVLYPEGKVINTN
ncbi:hypothetical protein HW45_01905 [Vibrio sp. ER1A]|nr:hypothetical protein HW45_01905 [Vibrio sp. ER1A]